MDHPRASEELNLQTANLRLSDLLRTSPLDLATGGASALADTLWVWGVLGGKNVGKSTLINALAGGDVVDRGVDAGEGTIEPGAYVSAGDLPALRVRLGRADGVAVRYHAEAPESMRRLALVDLPDFDSLFTDHVETVRRISGVLDGIIWVTTPKKVGDLRAIREIRRVLKSRTNFVYVVNKMDWLIAQSDASAGDELNRTRAALAAQVREGNGAVMDRHTFLVSAQHPTKDAFLASVATSRGVAAPVAADAEMSQAADAVTTDFRALREMLTTAPTSEAALANKRANLDYQVQTQAAQILEHHQPRTTLNRLDRALEPAALAEFADRYFPSGYVATLLRRLNSDRELFADWSSALFRQRIGYWPTLGLVAWPVMLLGGVVGRLRGMLTSGQPAGAGDLFRCDGVGLDERVSGAVEGVRARLSGEASRLAIELPEENALERQFRQDVAGVVEHQRSHLLDSMLARRPGAIGRMIRGLVPIAALLWFPLVQPLLVAGLTIAGGGLKPDVATLLALVQALSATKVLTGLAVSLLILAALAAAVYSRVVRDTYEAIDSIRSAPPDADGDPFGAAVIASIAKPVEAVRQQLATTTESLEHLATRPAQAPDAT